MNIKELLKQQNKEFKDNFFVEVGFGEDNIPYQIAHKNKNGSCSFIEKNDIETFIYRKQIELIRTVCDEIFDKIKDEKFEEDNEKYLIENDKLKNIISIIKKGA